MRTGLGLLHGSVEPGLVGCCAEVDFAGGCWIELGLVRDCSVTATRCEFAALAPRVCSLSSVDVSPQPTMPICNNTVMSERRPERIRVCMITPSFFFCT